MLLDRTSGSRRLRAPQGGGQTLIDPPWESFPERVARHRDELSRTAYDVQGRSLVELAAEARQALFSAALHYTSQYRNVPESWRNVAAAARSPFILAGHQPQLFHPGVWYKNFVLGGAAARVSGVGIHLLIDSDLCRSASVRVPTGSPEQPRVEIVPFDEPAEEVPFEERAIRDFSVFASFADRVRQRLEPLVREPLVEELWPLTLEREPRESNLGLRTASGRHALEERWGNTTLELPQSAVCGLSAFAWFVTHILAHLPRFWSAYNDALAAYRKIHRLRNRAHPVPGLAESDGWLEAPFWIWSADDPQRRAMFVRSSGDELIVSDRGSRTLRLALSADRDATLAVEQLQDAAHQGIKIRTRALTTTLFARLMLSDLFLHGIGGAKYDQVTDQIARTFFGFELAEYAAVSATLRLPIAASGETTADRSAESQLRELQYHPERFIDEDGAARNGAAEIIAVKRRWIMIPQTPQNARERHVAITSANTALQPFVAEHRRRIEREREELQRRKRGEAILQSREYSFCLFPSSQIARLLAPQLGSDQMAGPAGKLAE